MMATFSMVRWGRVLIAVVATHLANVVLSAVLIVAYSLLVIGPQGDPDVSSVDRFASLSSTWTIPLLTLLAATWAAHGAWPDMAVRDGLAVGVLVATIFGVLFFWPNDLWSLALFTLTVAAGFVGGMIRKTIGADRTEPE